MSPKTLDNLLYWTAIILPTWIVLRSGRPGIAIGAILQWGMLIVAGIALAATVPDRDFNLDALWVLVGWIPCLLFCLLLYLIKRGAVWSWARLRKV